MSYSPEQETRTWWERALIPFIYVRLAQKFSYDAVNDPESPAAAASGQYPDDPARGLRAHRRPQSRCGRSAGRRGAGATGQAGRRTAAFRVGTRDHARADVSDVWRDVGRLDEEPVSLDVRHFPGRGAGTAIDCAVDTFAATSAHAAASNLWVRLGWCCWPGGTPLMRRNCGEIVFRRPLPYTICLRWRCTRRRFWSRSGSMCREASRGRAGSIP